MRTSHRRSITRAIVLLLATMGLESQARPPDGRPAPPAGKADDKPQPPPADRAVENKEAPAKKPQAKAKAEPRPQPRPWDRGGETRVMTRAEYEARKRSPFLLPPGGSPEDLLHGQEYDDGRDEPPWRQASFFGVRARGRFFVYVLDQSGSMIDDDRLTRATIELRRSVGALQSPQQFEVVFYNDESTTMPGGPTPRTADQKNKNLLASWLRLIDPDGETDPLGAIKQALALRPDAVFLLSDGAFPDGAVEAVAASNARKIPIHCIDLAGGLAGDHLQRIARESGGRYASRPGNLQGGGSPSR